MLLETGSYRSLNLGNVRKNYIGFFFLTIGLLRAFSTLREDHFSGRVNSAALVFSDHLTELVFVKESLGCGVCARTHYIQRLLIWECLCGNGV